MTTARRCTGSWACQSRQIWATVSSSCRVEAGAWLIWCWTRAISSTSSAMRASRSAFCWTMWARRFCAGSCRSSSSSALACTMAARGLRISWATAADMRPMAASFSVRRRASISRKSCKNITHSRSVWASRAASRVDVSQVRTCRPVGLWPGCSRSTSAVWGCSWRKVRRARISNGFQGEADCRVNGRSGRAPLASNCRPAGLATRTTSFSSTTSTPSVRFWMTKALTWVCTRAAIWLCCATSCSRASRVANWCTR